MDSSSSNSVCSVGEGSIRDTATATAAAIICGLSIISTGKSTVHRRD